jgi:hypothetical protein
MTERRYTVKEFADMQRFSEEYVRQMCRQQEDPRKGLQYSLPEGWSAKKIGRDWFLFREQEAPLRKKFADVGSLCEAIENVQGVLASSSTGPIHLFVQLHPDGRSDMRVRAGTKQLQHRLKEALGK